MQEGKIAIPPEILKIIFDLVCKQGTLSDFWALNLTCREWFRVINSVELFTWVKYFMRKYDNLGRGYTYDIVPKTLCVCINGGGCEPYQFCIYDLKRNRNTIDIMCGFTGRVIRGVDIITGEELNPEKLVEACLQYNKYVKWSDKRDTFIVLADGHMSINDELKKHLEKRRQLFI